MNDWFNTPLPAVAVPAAIGRVAPVYWEPVPQSGERFCIALLAYGSGGAASFSTVGRAVKCLGTLGSSLSYFGSLVALDYKRDVSLGAAPENWRPRLGGMVVGQWIEAYGADLEAAAAAYIQCFSSLCVIREESDEESREVSPVIPRPKELRRFVLSIRSRVDQLNTQLASLFDQQYSLMETRASAKSTVDYMSARYAVCYSVLNPSSPNARLYANDSLWRLARARDSSLVPPKQTEAVLWVPDPELPIFTRDALDLAQEHVMELTAEAKKEGLGVATVTSVDAAAERLVLAEGVSVA